MGFESNAIKFLLNIRRGDIQFGKTITLGRQSYQLNEVDFLEIMAQSGIDREDARTLLRHDKYYVEPFLKKLGASEVQSMDASSYESATLIHDLNLPIPAELRNQYDTVIDAGTLEHIFNFPTAIKNCMEMIKVGGHFIGITITNNFPGHGFYQFSPELFFRIFSPENGFETKKMLLAVSEGGCWYEIPDPKEIKKRVLFENSKQSFLLVLAKKTSEKNIFSNIPQQSDYEHLAWQGKDQFTRSKKSLSKKIFSFIPDHRQKKIRRALRIIDPRAWKVFLRDTGSGNKSDFKKLKN